MIAIHHRDKGFSQKWIEYCETRGISYKLVDCYDSDIVAQLAGCTILMWHWAHNDHKAILFARQLICSIELMGIKVFPDSQTCWHYDDKVGQKYLLEAIDAPLVPSYVFYKQSDALAWLNTTSFPKVFKLRNGAGSENVLKVASAKKAKQLIRKAFGSGFSARTRLSLLKERVWRFRRDKSIQSLLLVAKGLARLAIPTIQEKMFPAERNYAYFQDFLPDNDCDIRVIVIGSRAFAIKRMVREGDFRASGSGKIVYDPSEIPPQCLKIAFDVTSRIYAQCVAYDFVFDAEGEPKIVEIGYAFNVKVYLPCPGYWDQDLNWTPGSFRPEYFMIEDLIDKA